MRFAHVALRQRDFVEFESQVPVALVGQANHIVAMGRDGAIEVGVLSPGVLTVQEGPLRCVGFS